MFVDSQMYLPTTVLITIFFSRTSVSQFEGYQHWLPEPTQSPQPLPLPQPTELSQTYSAQMIGLPPMYVYPLYLRLTSEDKSTMSSNEEKPQRLQSSDQQVATKVDEYRVPSHFFPLAAKKKHRNTTTVHFSDSETHEEQFNDDQKTNNSSAGSGEQNDNSIGVEHLPTIAVPFLSLIHI